MGAEGAHFWGVVLTIPLFIFGAIHELWWMLSWVVLVQIVLNLYPVMHLRQVRARIEASIQRSVKNPRGPETPLIQSPEKR